MNCVFELRKNQTDAEDILWQQLQNRKFKELKFIRQFPFVYGNVGCEKTFFYCRLLLC